MFLIKKYVLQSLKEEYTYILEQMLHGNIEIFHWKHKKIFYVIFMKCYFITSFYENFIFF